MDLASPRPLIFVNDANTVALIDVPTSISHAQGTKDAAFHYSLLSTEPSHTPFQDNEPKTRTARDRVSERNPALPEDELYQKLIGAALAEIRLSHHRDWCYPRRISSFSTSEKPEQIAEQRSKRQRRNEDQNEQLATNIAATDQSETTSTGNESSVEAPRSVDKSSTVINTSAYESREIHVGDHIVRAFYVNVKDSRCLLSFGGNSSLHHSKFYCPPRASFIASDIKDYTHVHRCQRAMLDANQRQLFDYDLIVIDPPWPNRSARRNHGKSSYETSSRPMDTVVMIIDLDLNKYLADGGYVAVWITNQLRVNDSILAADGLFSQLNVVPEEEWIWIKTTIHGEPVTKLDGVWRKPYEVLLIGRHWKYLSSYQCTSPLKRRVLAGVPDLHSRKPCLKSLAERWLHLDEGKHHVLEIFARNLVSGWDSWGLEVLKFQNVESWAPHNAEVRDSRIP